MIDLTLTQALQKLRSREITAVELTTAYLDRIEKFGAELNCYITVTRERALNDAAASDARYAAGNPLPLDGIPIGMKDLFATKGIRTTAASRMLENFIPEYESTVSQKLADAGCVLLGKTNCDEFAMGSKGGFSYFGPAINPYQRERKLTPGGSSSGSVSAVSGGLALIATMTDTAGSGRFPAAITGLVSIKPTYGMCSRWGCVAFASSLDHPGPVARTVDDVALALSAMAGHDEKESTSAPNSDEIAQSIANAMIFTPALAAGVGSRVCGPGGGFIESDDTNNNDTLTNEPTPRGAQKSATAIPRELRAGVKLPPIPLRGLKIGIIKEFAGLEISDDMRKIQNAHLENLKSNGAEIIEISIPNILDALAVYYIIAPAEASSNLARYDGMRYGLRIPGKDVDDTYKKTRAAGFGEEVQRRMVVGTAVLSSESYEVYFMQAARIRRMIDDAFNAAFEKCDFIVCPSSAGPAFPQADKLTPLEEYALDLFTVPMNLSGIPAVSVPAGLSANGLPLGLQVVGRRFDDLRVLQLSKHIEIFAGLDNRPTTVMGE